MIFCKNHRALYQRMSNFLCTTTVMPIQGLIQYGSARFIFINGQDNGVVLGVVGCDGSSNTTGSPSLPDTCQYGSGYACSTGDSQTTYTAGFSVSMSKGLSAMATNSNIVWNLEPGSQTFNNTDVYYGDLVYLSIIIPGGAVYVKYDSGCEHSAPYLVDDYNDATQFKLTTPSGQSSNDGNAVMITEPTEGSPSGAIAFETPAHIGISSQTYLFFDNSGSYNTNGWVWAFHTNGDSTFQTQTAWYPIPFSPAQCGRVDPFDTSNYLWSPQVCGWYNATNTIGDANYGVWSGQSPAPTGGSNMAYIVNPDEAQHGKSVQVPSGYTLYPLGTEEPSFCAIVGGTGSLTTGPCFMTQVAVASEPKPNMSYCSQAVIGIDGNTIETPVSPVPFQGLWESQTTNPKNRVMCCGGVATSTSACHPYYCPQSTVNFGVGSNDGGNCLNAMEKACTAEGWSKLYQNPQDTEAYIGLSCDSYIAQGNQTSAAAVAQNAIANFYGSDGYKPTDDHPFVRRSIQLANKYPGIADATFASVCSSYSIDDLETGNWSERKWDPGGTNLLDTCGCFLPSNNYYLDESENINVVCNNVCGFPNAVKPLDSTTGDFLKCGGTEGANVCVISNLVMDQINSSGGGININQTCDLSGGGPSVCYLGGIELSGVGGIQVSQNCDVCYNFNPKDPSQPAQRISCTTTPSGGGTSASGDDVCLGNRVVSSYAGKAFKWLLLGVIVMMVLMLIVGLFRQYSNSRKLKKGMSYKQQYANVVNTVYSQMPQQ